MNRPHRIGRWVVIAGGMILLSVALFRAPIVAAILRVALAAAGVGDAQLTVDHVGPTRLEVSHATWKVQGQPWSLDRLAVQRDHWYSPDFGAVTAEGLRGVIPLEPHGVTEPDPSAAARPIDGPVAPARPVPARAVSIDGRVVLQAPAAQQELQVGLKAERAVDGSWRSQLEAGAPGLELKLNVDSAADGVRHDFRLTRGTADLARLQAFTVAVLGVAPRDYQAGGTVEVSSEGRIDGARLTGRAQVRVREGRVASEQDQFAVEGLEADLAIDDLAALNSAAPQRVSVRSARRGAVVASDLAATLGLQGPRRLEVKSLAVSVFGGRLSTEPFTVDPRVGQFSATVMLDRLRLEEVMRLVKDAPARASGELSGRVPLAYGAEGLALGQGWLGLPAGGAATVELQADGLLTGGMKPDHPGYPVLRQVETGLLKLRVQKLRLDLHPDGLEAERSAVLTLAGEPIDPKIHAPVILDLNFRGPIEQLLNAGLQSGVQNSRPNP